MSLHDDDKPVRNSADDQKQYVAGSEARSEGLGRLACPHMSMTRQSAWWLAGWHDEDMQRQTPIIKRRRRRVEKEDGVRL